jgi:hypothetical protein
MKILALDIAKQCGWCVGEVGQKIPLFHSYRFASRTASHDVAYLSTSLPLMLFGETRAKA